jgi:hypothetical protein
MQEVQGNSHFQISKVISADVADTDRVNIVGALSDLRPNSDKYLDVLAPNDPEMMIHIPRSSLVVLVPIGQSLGS